MQNGQPEIIPCKLGIKDMLDEPYQQVEEGSTTLIFYLKSKTTESARRERDIYT